MLDVSDGAPFSAADVVFTFELLRRTRGRGGGGAACQPIARAIQPTGARRCGARSVGAAQQHRRGESSPLLTPRLRGPALRYSPVVTRDDASAERL